MPERPPSGDGCTLPRRSPPPDSPSTCRAREHTRILGQCRRTDPTRIDALLDLLDLPDATADVPWDEELARAVVRVSDDRFVPLLVRLCTAPRPVALVALDALAVLRPGPVAVHTLVAVFTGSPDDRRVHRAASRALVAAGPAAVAALLPYVPWKREADRRVRQSLAWFFGRADCGTGRAVRVLAEFLSDPCSRTRAEAAASLGLRGDPTAGPLLQRAPAHPDERVRARAATALGRVGAHGAVEQLRRTTPSRPSATRPRRPSGP
ncbi:HEAT repeat domain-containing protein [Streptomyces sp. NRRL B-24484]|uniref:HEAT repeat domain-containing protein n=1 Tax=Streptomyces sp. NRRL B-24484 TaxID=1463833 RepID=UPI0004C21784|nr:HEAT repeat domain-containing protein [Streptomyces sp. NRRL B-24484]